jgi:hypothetical protein
MSPAAKALVAVYEEWRRETLAEASAISLGDWAEVSVIQSRKVLLRQRIESGPLAEVAGTLKGDDELLIRAFVSELIRLELSNDSAIEAKRLEANEEMALIDAAAGNLRRVQRYAQPTESAWAVYS